MREIKINETTWYVGANDRKTPLFENNWPLPYGVSYNSYLINLDQIALIKKDIVEVGGDEVPISRSFKKSFMNAVTAFNCGR